jgi:hypothetical protein
VQENLNFLHAKEKEEDEELGKEMEGIMVSQYVYSNKERI